MGRSTGRFVEESVELVCDVDVVEWGRVGVVAQGRGGVAVPEPTCALRRWPSSTSAVATECRNRCSAASRNPVRSRKPDEPVGQQDGRAWIARR
jgi:hypothetical protein